MLSQRSKLLKLCATTLASLTIVLLLGPTRRVIPRRRRVTIVVAGPVSNGAR